MLRMVWLSVTLIALTLSSGKPLLAQTGTSTSSGSKERYMGRIVGTVGGVAAGLLVGLAISPDDVENATRNLYRNLAICSVAGGVGGYFLGRAVDKRLAFHRPVDPYRIRRAQAEVGEKLVKEYAARFPAAKSRSGAGGMPD